MWLASDWLFLRIVLIFGPPLCIFTVILLRLLVRHRFSFSLLLIELHRCSQRLHLTHYYRESSLVERVDKKIFSISTAITISANIKINDSNSSNSSNDSIQPEQRPNLAKSGSATFALYIPSYFLEAEDSVDNALQRRNVSFFFVFSFLLLLVCPLIIYIALIFFLFWHQYIFSGLFFGILYPVIVLLSFAITHWRLNNWKLKLKTKCAFIESFILYFGLAFSLTLLSSEEVTFFALSIHFVTAQFLCALEIGELVKDQCYIDSNDFLYSSNKADLASTSKVTNESDTQRSNVCKMASSFLYTDSNDKEDDSDGEVLDKIITQKMRAEFRKKSTTSSKTKTKRKSLLADVFPSFSIKSLPQCSLDSHATESKNLSTASLGQGEGSISSKLNSADMFASILSAQLFEQKLAKQSRGAKAGYFLYGLQFVVLIAYSVLTYYSLTDFRFFGIFNSVAILIFDFLCYFLVSNGFLESAASKFIFSFGVRLALIIFNPKLWFLNFSIIFMLVGVYLSTLAASSMIIFSCELSSRLKPWQNFNPNTASSSDGAYRTLNSFLVSLEKPKNPKFFSSPLAFISSSSGSSAFQNALHDENINIPAFFLFLVYVIYLCLATLAYKSAPPTISFLFLDAFPQYKIAFFCIPCMIFYFLTLLFLRAWQKNHWKGSGSLLLTTLVVEACFIAMAYLWDFYFPNRILFYLIALVPVMVFSFFAIVSLQVCYCRNDFASSVSDLHALPTPNSTPKISTVSSYRWRLFTFATLLFGSIFTIGYVGHLEFQPSFYGFVISFGVFIVLATVFPILRFIFILNIEQTDELFLGTSIFAVGVYFYILYDYFAPFSALQFSIFVILFSCFPLFFCCIAAIFEWKMNSFQSSPLVIFTLVFLLIDGYLATFLSFFLLSFSFGVFALVSMTMLSVLSVVGFKWMSNGFNFSSKFHRNMFLIPIIALVIFCIFSMFYFESPWDVVGFTSGAGMLAITFILAAYGAYTRLCNGGKAVRFSPQLFPIYSYDFRQNDVYESPEFLYWFFGVFGVFFLYSLICLCFELTSTGLVVSSLSLLFFYLYVRSFMTFSNRTFTEYAQFMDNDAVSRAKEESFSKQLDTLHLDMSEALIDGIRNGKITRDYFHTNLKKIWKTTYFKSIFSYPFVPFSRKKKALPYLELDAILEEMDNLQFSSELLLNLMDRVEATFYFLLLSYANTTKKAEEGLFRAFCSWLNSKTGGDIKLSYTVTDAEIYGTLLTKGWQMSRIVAVQKLKKLFLGEQRKRGEVNAYNRQIEEIAVKNREMAFELKEAQIKKLQEERELAEQDAKSAELYAMLNGKKAQVRNAGAPSVARTRVVKRNTETVKEAPRNEDLKSYAKGTKTTTNKKETAQKKTRRVDPEIQRDEQLPIYDFDMDRPIEEVIKNTDKSSTDLEEEYAVGSPVVAGEEWEGVEANDANVKPLASKRGTGKKSNNLSTSISKPLEEQTNEQGYEDEIDGEEDNQLVPSLPIVFTSKEEATKIFGAIQEEYSKCGIKWCDPTFEASDKSIYSEGKRIIGKPSAVHSSPVDGWRRPEEIFKAYQEFNSSTESNKNQPEVPKVCVDGFDVSDVVQGNIGTCYLLSAMGVMARKERFSPTSKLLSTLFPYVDFQIGYSPSGAYLIRFYRNNEENFVIIDDRLPVLPNGLPAFSHNKTASELWVSLIEKGYAKLFGSYENIEAGFIHTALKDMTNGVSEEIRMKNATGAFCLQSESLWLTIKDSFNNGFLLGAGSNTGTNDQESNGIVLGHAYMIIDVFEEDASSNKSGNSVRLVRLVNPWGHSEWTGEWSDNSANWTTFWKKRVQLHEKKLASGNFQLANPTDEFKDDGQFWMGFDDFCLHYENLYICRLLPHRHTLLSEWNESNSAGPRKPAQNPHFKLRVKKPQKVWIEIEQELPTKEQKNLLEETNSTAPEIQGLGKNGFAYVQIYVMELNGKRCQKIERPTIIGWANGGKLVNARLISAEILLSKPNYDYTIVCCTNQEGVKKKFSLSIVASERVTFLPMDE